MNIEEYKKLASLLNEARKILYDKDNLMWHLPKSSSYSKHWCRATDGIDKARDQSEELMFIECPEQASTYIFYPGNMIGQGIKESEKKDG